MTKFIVTVPDPFMAEIMPERGFSHLHCRPSPIPIRRAHPLDPPSNKSQCAHVDEYSYETEAVDGVGVVRSGLRFCKNLVQPNTPNGWLCPFHSRMLAPKVVRKFTDETKEFKSRLCLEVMRHRGHSMAEFDYLRHQRLKDVEVDSATIQKYFAKQLRDKRTNVLFAEVEALQA